MPSRIRPPALTSQPSAEEEQAHANLLPDRYFFQTDPTDIQRHLRLVHHLLAGIAASESIGALQPSIEWGPGPTAETASVHLATWDRPALFAKLVGALTFAVPADNPPHDRRMEPLVEIYRDTLAPRFIVEVHATDHPGLLHRLAAAIIAQGLDVSFARIDTARQIAFDTFHLAPAAHQPAPTDDDVARLRQALTDAAR